MNSSYYGRRRISVCMRVILFWFVCGLLTLPVMGADKDSRTGVETDGKNGQYAQPDIEELASQIADAEKREELLKQLRILARASEAGSEAEQTDAEENWYIPSFARLRTVWRSPQDIQNLAQRVVLSVFVLFLWVGGWILARRRWLRKGKTSLKVRSRAIGGFAVTGVLAVLFIWGAALGTIFSSGAGREFLANGVSIIFTVLGGWICWRVLTGYLSKRVAGDSSQGQPALSRRMQTLFPLFRNILRIVIIAAVTLVALAELGINIAPLLAGAGVVGLAVGLGAQTLVKDLIIGFTVLAEDAIRIGDWAILGGHDGQIEHLTIRHVRMRDIYGNVHVVPWSNVQGVTNQTRDYGYAVFEAGFAYRENIDEVVDVIRQVAAEMREDPALKGDILSDLQVLGLIELGDSAVVVRTRFRTKPFRRWFLERDFRRRVKNRFDELGIEIPYPHATVYFGQNKQGSAPPARVQLSENRQAQPERGE